MNNKIKRYDAYLPEGFGNEKMCKSSDVKTLEKENEELKKKADMWDEFLNKLMEICK